jgi:hypothetical protein
MRVVGAMRRETVTGEGARAPARHEGELFGYGMGEYALLQLAAGNGEGLATRLSQIIRTATADRLREGDTQAEVLAWIDGAERGLEAFVQAAEASDVFRKQPQEPSQQPAPIEQPDPPQQQEAPPRPEKAKADRHADAFAASLERLASLQASAGRGRPSAVAAAAPPAESAALQETPQKKPKRRRAAASPGSPKENAPKREADKGGATAKAGLRPKPRSRSQIAD